MISRIPTTLLILFAFLISVALQAQSVKILTNHIGYETKLEKKAIIISDHTTTIELFHLIDANGNELYSGKPTFNGTIDKWKNWVFWTIDISKVDIAGTYKLQITCDGKTIHSYPFSIGNNIFEKTTISDVVYYFKGQRSSGLLDKADHKLIRAGYPGDTIDAHGGWFDASGDYGKHLSHLSFSNYFNPQQISLTAWSLFKTYEQLTKRPAPDFRQYNRRVLDEAMYGADYLVRIQTNDGSFYRSVSAPGLGKLPKDRVLRAEDQSYRIKKTKDQPFNNSSINSNWKRYQVSYRSGGGLAIAALCMASALDVSGEYSNAEYLRGAERAFNFLEKNNKSMTYDGKENIIDDYCALIAATELYKVTRKDSYLVAAELRANNLMARLQSNAKYSDYWRADDIDRPFFHPSDAGLPIVSLIYFYPLANKSLQVKLKSVIKKSLQHELAITNEVTNPFGYSRQYVQDTLGNRRSTFFFPHGSEASPWWQGENARLASMATAARMASILFQNETEFRDQLQQFALNQLNWIVGLNPYDACMIQGTGHNNPAYGFFGTFEYTNAPGGIVNGITSGLENENDIDFNLSYAQIGKDYDWRWAEQWLPHSAWYLLAVSVK